MSQVFHQGARQIEDLLGKHPCPDITLNSGSRAVLQPALEFGLLDSSRLSADTRELLFPGGTACDLDSAAIDRAYQELSALSQVALSEIGVLASEKPFHGLQFLRLTHANIPTKNVFALATTNRGDAFIKFAGSEKAKRALRREALGAKLAASAGLQVPEILIDYREIGCFALFGMTHLGAEVALGVPNTVEARLSLPSNLGAEVAKALLKIFNQVPPPLAGTGVLPAVEKYTVDIATFRSDFERRCAIFGKAEALACGQRAARDTRWQGKSGDYVLEQWIEEAKGFLRFLDETPKHAEYFCLGDLGPQNLFFPLRYGATERFREPVVFFDLEVVGQTPHWALSALLDWGRFFYRASPNIALQRGFLSEILSQAPLGTTARTSDFLRTMILARLVLSSHLMEGPEFNPEYPGLDRLDALLASIGPTLDWLRSI